MKNFNFKNLLYWLAVGIWMAVIFILSSRSSFTIGGIDNRSDIISAIAHIGLYGVLMVLLIRAWLSGGASRRQAVIYSFVWCALYGITDEWHQSFVPGREAHLSDWLLNMLGAYIVMSVHTYKYVYLDRTRV